jgi:hypothetical protein
MTPDGPLKLVSQLLDLPLIDSEDRWCGVVDDVEFAGSAGKDARIASLLIGPGAYRGRLPGWAYWCVRKIAGDRITRVPVEAIATITAAVHLNRTAEDLKLYGAEDRARRWIPRQWAL